MHNRIGYETVGSSFHGNLVLRLQNSGERPPAGQHESALPCFNELYTQEGRKKDKEKTMDRVKKERQMEVCVFFLKTLYGEWNILSFGMFALSKEEIFCETSGGLWFCPLAMYS